MLKTVLAAIAALFTAAAFAAVDINQATQAELETIKGVGPGLSGKLLDERKKGSFKNWDDLIARVGGIGASSAAKLSAEGLTVGGARYEPAAVSARK